MMMTTKGKKLITSDDPKGLDATAKWRAVYNRMRLSDDKAQRLNESGEFWQNLARLMKYHSAEAIVNQVASTFNYPKKYLGPKPIEQQIKIIANIFGLNPTQALDYAKQLPALPEGAEGWFAYPKIATVAAKYFPQLRYRTEQYCEAVNLVNEKLALSREFDTVRLNQIIPNKLRQTELSRAYMDYFDSKQVGQIVIIAAQHGLLHRGKSVLKAGEDFRVNEFGLGAYIVACMALVHPERYEIDGQLHAYCAGDKYASNASIIALKVPSYCHNGTSMATITASVFHVHPQQAVVTAFVPR